MAAENELNQENQDQGGINIGTPQGDVTLKVRGDMVGGDKITNNVTNYYMRSAAEQQADLLKQAHDLFAELPTDVLPPVRPLPTPSRPVYGRSPHFVGREAELRELAQQLKAGKYTAIAATGLGGIGKSQLAIEFIHRYGQFFAGGVYWVNMAQPEAVPMELALCGARLGIVGIETLPQPQQAELVQNAWETPLPRLLIFDNCEDEGLYERYRPKTGNCRVLLTSRKGDWPSNVQMVPLRSLLRHDSKILLNKLCPHLIEAEADELAEELGDYPLALHLAGSYLNRYKQLPIQRFLQELQSDHLHHRAMALHRGVGENLSGHDWSVMRTFEISFKQLVTDEEPMDVDTQSKIQNPKSKVELVVDGLGLELLACAACFAPGEPIPMSLLWQTVSESDELLLEDGVLRLVELGLLEKEPVEEDSIAQTVKMHRLLVQFVQSVLAYEESQRSVDLAVSEEAIRLNKSRHPLIQLKLFSHLQFLTDAALQRRSGTSAILTIQFGSLLESLGDYEGAQSYYEKGLMVSRDVLGEHSLGTAMNLMKIGEFSEARGDHERASSYFTMALEIYEEQLGVQNRVVGILTHKLGSSLESLGDYARARWYLDEALSILREVSGEHDLDIASCLMSIGMLLQTKGDYEGARPYYDEALAIKREALGERHQDTAEILYFLGYLLKEQGDYAKALSYYSEALSIKREVWGDWHPSIAAVLNTLGEIYILQGSYGKARRFYEKALEINNKALGEVHLETAKSMNILGALLLNMGNYAEARPYLVKGLMISRKLLGDHDPDIVSSLINLALLYNHENDFTTAYTLMKKALEIQEAALGIDHPDTQSSRRLVATIAKQLA